MVFFLQILIELFCKQTVETLILHRIKHKKTLGVYELNKPIQLHSLTRSEPSSSSFVNVYLTAKEAHIFQYLF